MATIKSYTDLEQSKKLAEILPLESADMYWDYDYSIHTRKYKYHPIIIDDRFDDVCIPCWSLAALLNILSKQDFIIKSLERNNEYKYNIDIPSRHCKIWFSSLLDAVFEMICWLKEDNGL